MNQLINKQKDIVDERVNIRGAAQKANEMTGGKRNHFSSTHFKQMVKQLPNYDWSIQSSKKDILDDDELIFSKTDVLKIKQKITL